MKHYSTLATVTLAGWVLLQSHSAMHAASYTAASTGNWSTSTHWSPDGIPGSTDDVTIPAGVTITYDNSAPATVGPVFVQGGIVISKNGGTFGDFTIDTTGALSFGGQVPLTFSGNFTNLGTMNVSGQSQTANTTYSGTGYIVGNVTNQIANITGSYQNLGTLVVGVNAQNGNLTGSGTLVNYGTIIHKGNSTFAATLNLDCSPIGNNVIWQGMNVSGTPAPKATAYYNLALGNTGTAGWVLNGAGLTIANNLTIANVGGVTSWPANGSLGGTLYFQSTTGGGTVNFPAAFSVHALNQSAGVLGLPAGATLTITGTGAGVWTHSGGSITHNTTGTVRFTGAAPDLAGVTARNLLLDSTVSGATASAAFYATNSLTIVAGAALDLSALPGSTHTMLGTESLLHSGSITGTVVAVSGSKVYAGTDGGYATGTITGDLTMSSGSTVNLDVSASASGANDQLHIGGTLALNSTTFNLKASSAGAAIDTANDYTLVTASSISGSPVLHWTTAPADTNYTLVVTATSVKLHYGGVVTVGQPKLNYSYSGGVLTLSWDSATFPGFVLNQESVLGGVWTPVPGGDTSPVLITVNPSVRTAFFRLVK
jgi:hypothetical protein